MEPIGIPPPNVNPPQGWEEDDVEATEAGTAAGTGATGRVSEKQQSDVLSQAGHKSGTDDAQFSFDDKEIDRRLATNSSSYDRLQGPATTKTTAGDPVLGTEGVGNQWFNTSALAILSYYLLMIQEAFMKSQLLDNNYVTQTIGMFSQLAKDVKKLDEFAADKNFQKEFASAMGQFAQGTMSMSNAAVQGTQFVQSRSEMNAQLQQKQAESNMGYYKNDTDQTIAVDLGTGKATNTKTGEKIQIDHNKLSDKQLREIHDQSVPPPQNAPPAGTGQVRLAQSYLNKRELERTKPVKPTSDDPVAQAQHQRDQTRYDREVRKTDNDIYQQKDDLRRSGDDVANLTRFKNARAMGEADQKTTWWTRGVSQALGNWADGTSRLFSAVYGKEAEMAKAQSQYKQSGEQLISRWMDRSTEDRKKSYDNINQLIEFMMQMQNELAKLGIGYNR